MSFVLSMLIMLGFSQAIFSETDPTETMVVTVDGTDITADWSLMPEANSYTLYYAYADYKGDVDLDTIGSIKMGQSKSIFAPNLPSGVIFFTAIIAHADPGDILSNIAEFMPFGGTVTIPESGSVLIQVEDPGGFGSISIMGTKNEEVADIVISEIVGDDGSGSFVLTIRDDKPVSYTKNGALVNIIYHDDGSISFQTVDAKQGINFSKVAMGRSNDGADCNLGRKEYEKTLASDQLRLGFTTPVFDRAKEQGFPFEIYRHLYRIQFIFLVRLGEPTDQRVILANNKLLSYLAILHYSLEGIVDDMLQEYDEQCSTNTIVVPVCENQCIGEVISIDTFCPVPGGAEIMDTCGTFTGTNDEYYNIYYVLNSTLVGPKFHYDSCDETSQHLISQTCKDAEGQRQGWGIEYETSGVMKSADHYVNNQRDGHGYDFYSDGSVKIDWLWAIGKNTGYVGYEEDGRMVSCNYSADPICVWGTWY